MNKNRPTSGLVIPFNELSPEALQVWGRRRRNLASTTKKGMCVKISITSETWQTAFIPFDYNYALHAANYRIIHAYYWHLHYQRFANDSVNRRFKVFTFPN